MTDMAMFVQNGTAHVAASVFPVQITMNSSGRSPARFMLVRHPETEDWWAAAWVSTYSAKPMRVVFGKVLKAHTVSVSGFDLEVETEDGETSRVLVKPSSGGCCGNRLKNWNPFGSGVILAHAPFPTVEGSDD
ncbi:hypothetical protein PP301_gp003 [Gordonia phage GMA2]|uniref:Uncharacterized protein n=1 Tax=Gordonia phage GMA2 TaxID=1647283 RepID=A0A0K0N7A9_9CAUD|nr:hypothetical protein PP301_gp003 [Gordonia phage GMA2]AKJ72541.1 hypothetical protein GMA2_3 [Gordonia phage GMA2]